MSKAIEYDFQNVCRTCLSTVNLNSLYDKCKGQNCLDDMLMICTSIQYHVDDGLPVQICDDCISELKQSYKFALKCRDADAQLRIYMQKLVPDEYAIVHHSSDERSFSLKDPLEITEFTAEVDPKIGGARAELDLVIKTELDETPLNHLKSGIKVENIEIEPKTEHLLEVQADISKIRLLLDSHQAPQPQAYQCNICQTNFNVYSLFEQHQQLHKESQNNDEIPCISDNSSDSATLGEKKPYACPICDKSFKIKANLAIHKRSHPTVYSCSVCNIVIKRKSDLTRHMLTHTDMKPFACKLCNMLFKHRNSLRYHLLTHSGDKQYLCSICDETFDQQSGLAGHLLSHGERNEFLCNLCERSFATQGDLSAHLSSHVEKRPYSCTICSNAYKQPQHLKYHMRKHTGEKPYVCTVCGKRFSQPYGLPRHMLTHTGEKPFPCTFCVKSFQQKTHLNTHIMRMHTKETIEQLNNANNIHIDVTQ